MPVLHFVTICLWTIVSRHLVRPMKDDRVLSFAICWMGCAFHNQTSPHVKLLIATLRRRCTSRMKFASCYHLHASMMD